MIKFVLDMLAVFFGWIAAWAGYLLGATANELSVLIVNSILGINTR